MQTYLKNSCNIVYIQDVVRMTYETHYALSIVEFYIIIVIHRIKAVDQSAIEVGFEFTVQRVTLEDKAVCKRINFRPLVLEKIAKELKKKCVWVEKKVVVFVVMLVQSRPEILTFPLFPETV